MLLLVIQSVCAYVFTIKRSRPELTMELKGMEDTIFTGFFEILEPPNKSASVQIFSSVTKDSYLKTDIAPGPKQHFSFNLSKPDELVLRIASSPQHENMKIRFCYKTQFDTFNKDVAQKVVVKPAIITLNTFGGLLKKVSDQTYERARHMSRVRSEHRKLVFLVLSCSFLVIAGFAVVNYYQVMALKKFFKQKKLI